MSEPQTPDTDSSETLSTERRPIAAVIANISVAAGIVATIITLIAAGWRGFAICLVVVGILVGGGALVYQFGRTRWYQERSRRLRKYGFFGLSGLLLAAGIPMVILVHSSSGNPGTTECTTHAQVSGADTSAKNFIIGVKLTCAAPTGNQLWLVEEVLDQGKPGTNQHSEYYLAWQIPNATGIHTVNDQPLSCNTRRFYLISVNDDQLALLKSSHETSGGAYYDEPIDTYISKYVVSNEQINHTCNS